MIKVTTLATADIVLAAYLALKKSELFAVERPHGDKNRFTFKDHPARVSEAIDSMNQLAKCIDT